MTAAADGHGGIQNIVKVGTSVLVDTYRITLADTTFIDIPVTNGRSITGVSKTGTIGLVDTHTIKYNDGTTSTFTVTNGKKGDKGDNAYTWVKYASQEPTESSHSMGDIPDAWRGEYNGPLSSPPTDWKAYKWYKFKGDKGDPGAPATLANKSVTYQVGDSGSITPSGAWSSSVPVVPQGKYLWTKTSIQFNTGDPIVSYVSARQGIDGTGSVSSVNNVSPDETGNVTLTADDVSALPTTGGDLTGELRMNGQPISGLNEPTEGTQAAPKSYVDKRVPLDGSVPMTGNLAMGGNRVTGLAEPEDGGDAATKGYTDTKAALPKTASGTVIALSDTSSGPLQGLRIYGRTTQDGTPTPDNPVPLVSVGDGGSVGVTVAGKNLFDSSSLFPVAGVSATISDDGYTITVIGRGRYAGANTKIPIEAVRGKTVILAADSAMQTSHIAPGYFIQMTIATESGVTHYKTISPSSLYYSFDMPEDIRSVYLGVYVNNSNTSLDSDNTVVVTGLRVYLSSNAAWEPYITPQTLPISTPNGLPGIPVESGGNYTDADGQQWICDEVDFARGVYVQRIGTIDSYAGEAVSEPYLSTTGALSTGAKVLYVLATRIEAPIPEADLAAYAALHTNRPNTTVYNDAGAHMDVGYYPPNATMRQEDIMGALDHVGNAAKEYMDGKHFIATVSLPAASWIGDAAPYTQTVTVSGILATDFPHVTPVYSSTLATALAQKEAWSMVNMGVPGAGEITFTCFEEKPTTAIPIQIEVMR